MIATASPAAADFPRRMVLVIVEEHHGRGTFVVRVGESSCPWCGWGPMAAEAGARGFCPSCAGPILAVLPAPVPVPS